MNLNWLDKDEPYPVQSPCSICRTDDIISALDNCAWNVPNFTNVVQNLRVAAQETAVNKVVTEI